MKPGRWSRRGPLLLAGTLIGAAAVVTFIAWSLGQWRPQPEGGDFTLESAAGPVSLVDRRGQWTVLYFGFTHCPDACPVSLSRWAKVFDELPADKRDAAGLILISVDPWRDDPEHLAEYVDFFDPAFTGVTGSPEQIAKVAGRYGAEYERVELDSALAYTVDHSTWSYLINPRGEIVYMYPDDTPASVLADSLREHMQASEQH